MSKIVRIEFIEEIDRTPESSYGYFGDWSMGTNWVNDRIYRLVFDDGSDQYMKIGQIYDSYGQRGGFTDPQMVRPGEKIITVWEE